MEPDFGNDGGVFSQSKLASAIRDLLIRVYRTSGGEKVTSSVFFCLWRRYFKCCKIFNSLLEQPHMIIGSEAWKSSLLCRKNNRRRLEDTLPLGSTDFYLSEKKLFWCIYAHVWHWQSELSKRNFSTSTIMILMLSEGKSLSFKTNLPTVGTSVPWRSATLWGRLLSFFMLLLRRELCIDAFRPPDYVSTSLRTMHYVAKSVAISSQHHSWLALQLDVAVPTCFQKEVHGTGRWKRGE